MWGAVWVLFVDKKRVVVLGARSFVGKCVLSSLTLNGWLVTALSRNEVDDRNDSGVEWRRLDKDTFKIEKSQETEAICDWISLAPIRVLSDYLEFLDPTKIRRLVALSSTSRFTKGDSSDQREQDLARSLAKSEELLQAWAEAHGVEWIILRPTLIYGLGRDKNITEIARFIRRFGFFPVFGGARGLRQPVHAEDVAGACVEALQVPCAANRAYNLSGGETLPYRDMLARVFAALDRSPILVPVPLSAFRIAVALLRCLPRYRQWSSSMATRMNKDMVFDHHEASVDLAFQPRAFVLSSEDVATPQLSNS